MPPGSPLILGEEAYEVGWMVVPEFQGRGIAVAATAQAIELAKRDDKHRFMHAFPNVDNAPSNTICRKLGFELLGACEFEFPKGHLQRLAPGPARLAIGHASPYGDPPVTVELDRLR